MTTEYDEGFNAYGDDLELGNNPYEVGTKANSDWADGWKEAEQNDPLADMCNPDDDEDESEDDDF